MLYTLTTMNCKLRLKVKQIHIQIVPFWHSRKLNFNFKGKYPPQAKLLMCLVRVKLQ